MPKVTKQHGAYVIESTGAENFASFLGQAVSSFLQQKMNQQDRALKLQDSVEDVLSRRQKFLDLDPEKQDQFKRDDPAGVTALFDDTLLARAKGKKLPKGYQPYVPPTRKRTSTEQASLDESLAKSRKAKIDADAAESKQKLESKLQDEQLASLSNPTSLVEKFYGRTGKLPSTDELKAFAMTDDETRANYRQNMVGTIEHKTAQRDETLKKMMEQYQPQTKAEIDQLRQAADYVSLLRDDLPAKLPPSLEKERANLERRRVAATEAQVGISRQDIALRRATKHIELVQGLVNDGVDAQTANRVIGQTLANGGQLPDDFKLPANRMEGLKTRLAESQLELDALKIKEAAINNPKVKATLDIIQTKLAQGRIEDVAPNLDKELKVLYDAAGLPFEKRKTDGTVGAQILRLLAYYPDGQTNTPSAANQNLTAPGATQNMKGSIATADSVTAQSKKLSPELEAAVRPVITALGEAMKAAGDEVSARQIQDKLTKLKEALLTGDESKIRAVLLEK